MTNHQGAPDIIQKIEFHHIYIENGDIENIEGEELRGKQPHLLLHPPLQAAQDERFQHRHRCRHHHHHHQHPIQAALFVWYHATYAVTYECIIEDSACRIRIIYYTCIQPNI